MSGCHAILARLDNRDLHVRLCGRHAGVFFVSRKADAAVSMKAV